MFETKDLMQMYYCPECKDFFEEKGIVMEFNSYVSATLSNNIGDCPNGHLRSLDKEYLIYLPEKPIKHFNSSIISLDMKKFSEKKQIFQFNNISILHAACMGIISEGFENAIYKGTGDGFIVGLPSLDVSKAIEFCELLINNYLIKIDFISYRIGIDYGLFFSYTDLNERKDLMGQLVIDVTRISNFGDGKDINHVLLSENAAVNLNDSDELRKVNLKELGICLAKHRIPYKVYNYQSDSIGAEYKLSKS